MLFFPIFALQNSILPMNVSAGLELQYDIGEIPTWKPFIWNVSKDLKS